MLDQYEYLDQARLDFEAFAALEEQAEAKLLDYYAPGSEWQISTNFDGRQVCVEGKLTIHAAEGSFSRSAVGDEHSEVDAYGSSFTNAEA